MLTIRPYAAKDKDDVRFICLNSEGPCDLSPAGQHYILTTYCDYYIEQEPQNCFVAADENDRAVGYVICTENFEVFEKCFREQYVTRFTETEPSYFPGNALESVALQKKYSDLYPAHLHIDLLPPYQRMGAGTRMVDALCAHLRQKGVPGVMLTVGSTNHVGQSFYNKYGFTVLERVPGDVAYGLRL